MKLRIKFLAAVGALAAALIGSLTALPALAQTKVPLSEVSHIHGVAVDPADPSRLYLATHHGVWLASVDGTATKVSENSNDYMGFTPHPTEPSMFFGSGHPVEGGNAGFIVSKDGAKTWEQVSEGANGPVDFHAMAVSAADPNTIYGLYGDIQVSRDGGETWEVAGAPPADTFDLAGSATDPNTVFAATRQGLMLSRDGAKTWEATGPQGQPASLVEVAPDGTIYAFVLGSGLMKASEPSLDWQPLSNDFGQAALLHLAADPSAPTRLYAVTHESRVLASADGGKTWKRFGQ